MISREGMNEIPIYSTLSQNNRVAVVLACNSNAYPKE
jgi:hypothetical protein